MRYDHQKIEKKWQKQWQKAGLHKTPDTAKGKKNFHLLVEFPYPSGNLHVGHWYAFAVPDILARAMRMQGKNVMYPIGFDAFGLPAENAAIKNKLDPKKWTYGNIAYMKKQIQSMGTSFDWSREVITADPAYYKWTQWLFLQLFKKGLAYQKETAVNWCPKDKTVLANEQVIDGKCERCDSPVEQKMMLQWNIKITDYADRLIDDLDKLDWPKEIKESQKNWIGRSEGAEIDFPLNIDIGIKRIILLHGKGGSSAGAFKPWMKEQLEQRGYEVSVPDLPNSSEPNDEEQTDYVIQNCTLDEQTAVVGHSFGGIVALRILERGIKLGRVTLVGMPYSGNYLDKKKRTTVDAALHKGFDFKKIRSNCKAVVALYDTKDHVVPMSDGEIVAQKLGCLLLRGVGEKSHFNGEREFDVLRASVPTLTVFTTRPDTLFGATYLVLAPEHPWVQLAIDGKHTVLENKDEVREYVAAAKKKSELERVAEQKDKSGVQLKGVMAINPATGERIPLYVADYVLATYGTGAIMAVPAHDERDHESALKYHLPIKKVIEPLYIQSTEPGRVVEGKPFVEREAITAILEHWSEKKYLVLKWKKVAWYTFVTGGVEKGQTPEEAAVSEIRQETGYQNPKLVRYLGIEHSKFYHVPKGENRFGHFHTYHFKLADDTRLDISPEEQEKHEPLWMTADEIKKNLTTESMKDTWARFGQDTVYTGDGILTHSGQFSGLSVEEGKRVMAQAFGRLKKTYRLRDWIVSRQRYWGVPIPVIHCPTCGIVAVSDKDLPVKLPEVKDYLPEGSGKSPLAKATKWVEVPCPSCIERAKKKKYLIFDFDGVLADTVKANIKARILMGDAKTTEESKAAMEKYFTSKPWHSRDVLFSDADKERYDDWTYRYAVEVSKMKWQLFDGFVNEVKKIKNAKIAIVSAGHEMYSKDKLQESGIKYTHFLAGNHDHSKESKIERIAKAWGVDIKNVYYFTDALSDVYELEQLLDRKKIIGCAWGYLGKEKLLQGLPNDQILTAFEDIHALWKPTIAKRETDTLDTFVDSSWYFLRYTDPKNKKEFAAKKKMANWMPVDLYSGGAEHTTMHLLYSRFWQKALYDLGLVKDSEPYMRRMNRSLILGPDGQKMSKSRGNVIDPDEVVKRLGADTVRMYLAFIGPYSEVSSYPWNPNGVVGVRRFLERVWNVQEYVQKDGVKELDGLLHKTTKKVGEDIAAMKFNTAISQLMILLNEIEKQKKIGKTQWEMVLKLLAPFAPHTAEELWSLCKHKTSVHKEKWPRYDDALLKDESITIAIQVNGKTRGEVSVPSGADKAAVENAARDAVIGRLEGKKILRTIVVPNRLVNFVLEE